MKRPIDWTEADARRPICGLVSIAIIANITIAEADQLARKYFNHGKRFTGTTTHDQRMAVLNELGVAYRQVPFKRTSLAKYIRENIYYKPGFYMINVTGHVVTFNNGLVADQCGSVPFEKHWSKRKFITNVTEIL